MKLPHRCANRAIVSSVFFLCLQGITASSQAQTPRVFCGLGPPPSSAEYAEHERQEDRQRAALGYIVVCDQNLRRFDFASRARPLSEFSKRLAFEPVALENTPFSKFQLIGGISEIESSQGIVALLRVFRTDTGAIVGLREWDMSVTGGRIMSSRPDLQTEKVHDSPAQLMVQQSPAGRAVSLLYWVENRRNYELSIDANVKLQTPSPALVQLAESLPKSVSAKNKEPSMLRPGFPMDWPPSVPPLPPPPFSR